MFNSNIRNIVFAVAVLGLAVAAGSSYSLVVNGQVSSEKAIVVGGKTYVPLSVLKSFGVSSSFLETVIVSSFFFAWSSCPPVRSDLRKLSLIHHSVLQLESSILQQHLRLQRRCMMSFLRFLLFSTSRQRRFALCCWG